MKGSELKKILQQEGVNLSDLAKKMGFESDQRLHSALKAEDVKSGLIEKIATATNKSVGYFYQTNIAIATDNSIAFNKVNEQETNSNNRFIALLEKKDEQIDRLITIIENKL